MMMPASFSEETMFSPFRLWVSVVGCTVKIYSVLSTDTPDAWVSVIEVKPHRHPASGVSVGNIHVYCKLWLTTDTYPKIRKTCFHHRLTCDLVAINHALGILT